jgi:hypothetical protein
VTKRVFVVQAKSFGRDFCTVLHGISDAVCHGAQDILSIAVFLSMIVAFTTVDAKSKVGSALPVHHHEQQRVPPVQLSV